MRHVARYGNRMDAAVQQTVTQNIDTALAVRGMKRPQFGRAMGMSRGALGNRMRGITSWTLVDISRAGAVLGVPPHVILQEKKYVLLALAEETAEAS